MFLGILVLIISIINATAFIGGIALIVMELYYGIFIAIGAFFNCLINGHIFSAYTRKHLRNEKEALLNFKLVKCRWRLRGISVIDFRYEDKKWVCVKDPTIAFELEGYLFKKSFIVARIVRALMYPEISNQLHLGTLMKMRLWSGNVDNLLVRFHKGNRIRKYRVVKSYRIRNTLLSKAVTKSKYYGLDHTVRAYWRNLGVVKKINEVNFLN